MKKTEDKAAIRRFLDNEYDRDDATLILGQIGEPEFENIIKEVASEIWEEQDKLMHPSEEEYMKAHREAQQLLGSLHRNRHFWMRRAISVSAGIAAMILLTIGVYQVTFRIQPEETVSYLTQATSFGEQREILLPDGTYVILNSCSSLEYPARFSEGIRQVSIQGEGFFQVAPDAKKPFRIKTSRFNVQVLGTVFNVKSYPTDETVFVGVESGKVQVEMPEAMMRIGANEHIFLNTQSGDYNKYREEKAIAQWRDGIMTFYNMPIHDVALELERQYGCKIKFAPGYTYDNRISGSHDIDNLENILKSIEYITGIRYKKEEGQIYFYK